MQNYTSKDLLLNIFNGFIGRYRKILKELNPFIMISKWNISDNHIQHRLLSKTFVILFLIGFTYNATFAQTTLSAGDIVLTGYNADDGDQFSFLLLVDVDASTVINFTDQGWTGSAFFTASSTEGIAVWTSGAALTCGTEVVISATDASNSTADTGTTTGGFDFATSGDQIIAYQGSSASPSFITAFHNESGQFDATATNINDSALPTGLVEGISAFAVNPENDNVVYSGTTISGTAEDIRTAIYANSGNASQSSNWTANSSSGQTLSTITWSFSSCLVSDTAPPVVQSIVLDGSPSANATSVTYTVTYDENANNITTDDFTLTTTGTASGTIASTSVNSGTTTTITINTIGGEGTLRLDHLGSTDVTDNSGNGNGTNGNVAAFTTGSVHTLDVVVPTVIITSTESSPTGANPIPVTITFSESVTGFDINDLNIGNGMSGNFNGTGAIYTADITPTAAGAVTVNISANAANDSAGNNNTAAIQFSITYDNTLSFRDELLAKELLMYPIPAKEIITISGKTDLGLKEANIFDIRGKLIRTIKLNSDTSINTIDVSTIDSGLYLIKISSETGSTTKRLIKR